MFLIWIWKYWKESTDNIRRKENIRNMGSEEAKHLKCFTQNTTTYCWCFADTGQGNAQSDVRPDRHGRAVVKLKTLEQRRDGEESPFKGYLRGICELDSWTTSIILSGNSLEMQIWGPILDWIRNSRVGPAICVLSSPPSDSVEVWELLFQCN